jgi:hypothetical protein
MRTTRRRALFGAWPRRARSHVEVSERYALLLSHGQVRPLDARQLHEIDTYAREALGDARVAAELCLYAAIRGGFMPGWITEGYFGRRVLSRISTEAGRRIGPIRTLMTTLIGVDGVPELARRVGGRWYDDHGLPTDRAEIATMAAGYGTQVIVKCDGSGRSEGVTVMPISAFLAEEPDPRSDVVVQYLVRPHPVLGALSPGSTPPLRVLTVMHDGAPQLAAAHIRLGTGARSFAGGPDAVRIPVLMDGHLGRVGADATLRLHEHHPVTGAAFRGTCVPSFADAAARCVEWHQRLPHAGVIGWDVAVDEGGAIHLMEMNTFHPGIFFHEALSGPNFIEFGWERFAAVEPRS